jgi:hypothetical protein
MRLHDSTRMPAMDVPATEQGRFRAAAADLTDQRQL